MTLASKYLGQYTRLNVLLDTLQADIREHVDNIDLRHSLIHDIHFIKIMHFQCTSKWL